MGLLDGKFIKDSTITSLKLAPGVGVPAGANLEIQFNDNSNFGSSSNFTWNNATLRIGPVGDVTHSQHTQTFFALFNSDGSSKAVNIYNVNDVGVIDIRGGAFAGPDFTRIFLSTVPDTAGTIPVKFPLSFTSTTAIKVPSGTTAERPNILLNDDEGAFRFNETDVKFEGWDGLNWIQFGKQSNGIINEVQVSNGIGDFVASKLFFNNATGNMTLGDAALAGTTRNINVSGSSVNVDLTLLTQGLGILKLNNEGGGFSLSSVSSINSGAANSSNIKGIDVDGSATNAGAIKIEGGSSAIDNIKGGTVYLIGGHSTTGTTSGGDVYIQGGNHSNNVSGSIFIQADYKYFDTKNSAGMASTTAQSRFTARFNDLTGKGVMSSFSRYAQNGTAVNGLSGAMQFYVEGNTTFGFAEIDVINTNVSTGDSAMEFSIRGVAGDRVALSLAFDATNFYANNGSSQLFKLDRISSTGSRVFFPQIPIDGTTEDLLAYGINGELIKIPQANLPTGGGTPGGALTSIQYNNAGAFGGFGTWENLATGILSVGDLTVAHSKITIQPLSSAADTSIEIGAKGAGSVELDSGGTSNITLRSEARVVVDNSGATGSTDDMGLQILQLSSNATKLSSRVYPLQIIVQPVGVTPTVGHGVGISINVATDGASVEHNILFEAADVTPNAFRSAFAVTGKRGVAPADDIFRVDMTTTNSTAFMKTVTPIFYLGETNVHDKYIYAGNTTGTPYIRYNELTNIWEFSNDGTTVGPLTINTINASQVTFDTLNTTQYNVNETNLQTAIEKIAQILDTQSNEFLTLTVNLTESEIKNLGTSPIQLFPITANKFFMPIQGTFITTGVNNYATNLDLEIYYMGDSSGSFEFNGALTASRPGKKRMTFMTKTPNENVYGEDAAVILRAKNGINPTGTGNSGVLKLVYSLVEY